MSKKKIIILALATIVFLGCILFSSPYRLPLLFVIVPEVAFVVMVAITVSAVVKMLHASAALGRSITAIITAVLAVVGVLLSVGQLTFKDFFLLFGLTLVGIFYVSRMLNKKA